MTRPDCQVEEEGERVGGVGIHKHVVEISLPLCTPASQ